MRWIATLLLAAWISQSYASFTTPDANQTPGKLCSLNDPNFSGYDYPEHVARCDRHVPRREKEQVAAAYGGIPSSDWPKYEFDHLIPLCAGGSNDPANLWPQPLDQAHKKDQLENDVCLAMRAGTMTQQQAVGKLQDWFNSTAQLENPAEAAHVFCNNKYGVSVRFNILEPGWISNISLNVEDNEGEHEAFREPGSLARHQTGADANPVFDGYNRFVLSSAKSKDVFEVYLPQRLSSHLKNFRGYLKVAFDRGWPHLSHLTCAQ